MLKILRTKDFDELTAAQEAWEIDHRPVNAERFEGHLVLGRVGGIQVDLERWSTAVELVGTSPERGCSLALPLCEDDSYWSDGLEVTGDRIDVFGPGCEIHAVTGRQNALIACSISGDTLEQLIDSPVAEALAEHATGHGVARSIPQTTRKLRHWWMKVLDLAAEEQIPAEAHRRLLDETLVHIEQALSAERKNHGAKARPRYRIARRARDYMLERQTSPPPITEICAFVNTTERTLHYAFGEVYGVSPKRFLKAQRLFAAHQALKFAAQGTRVSEIALGLGFWDLGYFARDYEAMFGELPSTTLRKTRA
jgi:AraC family ethanolamine operon transcriptional activator